MPEFEADKQTFMIITNRRNRKAFFTMKFKPFPPQKSNENNQT